MCSLWFNRYLAPNKLHAITVTNDDLILWQYMAYTKSRVNGFNACLALHHNKTVLIVLFHVLFID